MPDCEEVRTGCVDGCPLLGFVGAVVNGMDIGTETEGGGAVEKR